MGIRVELEMLAVLLLLTPIMSDGLVMTKCQVVDQLMATVPTDVLDRDNLVAKLACRAGTASHFDTSYISKVSPSDLLGIRKTRSAPKKDSAPKTITHSPSTTTTLPPDTTHKSKSQTTDLAPNVQDVTREHVINQTEPPMAPKFNYSNNGDEMLPPPPHNMNPHNKRGVSELLKLYGVFQLADRVACTSPNVSSFNICNLSCDKLKDADITDDINCALTIIYSKPNKISNPNGQEEANYFILAMRSTLMKGCPKMDYTQYLAECNNP